MGQVSLLQELCCLLLSRMGGDDHSNKNKDLVNSVNTWFWPSFGLAGASSLFFGIYVGKISNAHEWREIFLDYCHHKRTIYSGNPLDSMARGVLRLLRVSPK